MAICYSSLRKFIIATDKRKECSFYQSLFFYQIYFNFKRKTGLFMCIIMELFYPEWPENIKPVSESKQEPTSSRLIIWNKASWELQSLRRKGKFLHPGPPDACQHNLLKYHRSTQSTTIGICLSQGHEQSQKHMRPRRLAWTWNWMQVSVPEVRALEEFNFSRQRDRQLRDSWISVNI